MELRDYQTRIVDMVRDKIREGHKRILAVLPTGGGKTHVMGYITSRCIENGHKVLALMHRRQLVAQMCDRFADCGVDTATIMAGTDSSLGKQCQVATIQTYGRRLQFIDPQLNPWFIDASVVLVDETHHILSKTFQNVMALYKDKIVIGVTATPVLASGVGMGEYFDCLVSPVTVQELIDAGHLVPGEYYGPSQVDLSGISIVRGDYDLGSLNKVMSQPKIIGDVVQSWLRIAGGLRTMVFAVKVSHSKALVQEFRDCGVRAEHLDAHSDDDERSEVLDRFRNGDTQVLCNVGLYTEGSDIPELECIQLARPTRSVGLHLQMIGRGARPYPGKDRFVVIDHGGNVERLGFYEDEIVWSLDGKKQGYEVKKPRKKERTLITCEYCSSIFTGRRCSQCGNEVQHYDKKIEAADAELVKLRGKSTPKPTKEDKIRWYSMLEYYRRKKGYQHGWSAHKYREKFSVWPKGMSGVHPQEPDAEVANWIRYLNIRAAKGRQRARQQ